MDRDPRLVLDGDVMVDAAVEDSALLHSAVTAEPGERFLEIGVGEGLVALHAARLIEVLVADVNPAAVGLAVQNAVKHRLRIDAVRCDLMDALRGPFDVIPFNPPYLEGNPSDDMERAWAGGQGGGRVALRFLQDLPRILAPDGQAYILLADHDEAARACAESRFKVRVLASKHLFFEELEVLELRPPAS